jgi:hypothetical protein
MLFFLSVRVDPKNMNLDKLGIVLLRKAEAMLVGRKAG